MTIDQAFSLALGHHQAGRLAQAEGIYRQILAVVPNHADVTHLLGVIAIQAQQPRMAVELIEKAIALAGPGNVPARYWSNLGEAWRYLGEFERAMGLYNRALELDPQNADAAVNSINCLMQANRPEEVPARIRDFLTRFPDNAALHRMLGDAHARLRQFEEAIAAYRSCTLHAPNNGEAHYNLGVAQLMAARPADAVGVFTRATALQPGDIDSWLGLAEAYTRVGYHRESFEAFGQVLKINPAHAEAHAGQAAELRALDRVDEAIVAFKRALSHKPGDAAILGNLGLALRDAGELREAMDTLRQAYEARLRPPAGPLTPEESQASARAAAAIHSAYVMTLYLVPWVTPQEIDAELDRWNQLHAAALPRFISPEAAETRHPPRDRRLRIGYISADLRNHPVGRFMMPVLEGHDRSRFEVYCYSVTSRQDLLQAALSAKTDHWRNASTLSPEELARQIHADGIDVLVDLSMHAIDNSLLAFARKPAPVQITYLAYCAGTGLRTIDWRLTDRIIDPPASDPSPPPPFERPLYLDTYWCYSPHPSAGEVSPLPALAGPGIITLGSFNFFSKINDELLDAWARLLGEMNAARLFLHVPVGTLQQRIREFFVSRGIASERLTLFGRVADAEYLGRYAQVDIALDTYPFAGGTTTCDALYMGVPVVTRAGPRTTSRGGASILTALGMPEFIARDWDDYRRIVRDLAADVPRLAEIRRNLRQRMHASPLMDAPQFVRTLERRFLDAALHRAHP